MKFYGDRFTDNPQVLYIGEVFRGYSCPLCYVVTFLIDGLHYSIRGPWRSLNQSIIRTHELLIPFHPTLSDSSPALSEKKPRMSDGDGY